MNPKADFTFIKKVAILPFVNLTNDKFAGDKVRDIVTTEVLSRGFFDVVEWGEVSRVLGEESKGLSTEIDKETAKRIGKRLQIQAIILGTVEEYGTSRGGGRSSPEVAISIRMIDINSSKILWQASYDKKGGGVISRLFGVGEKSISEVARKLVKEVLDTLFGSGQQKQEKEEE
ncbi:MAG: CsgG/HfaB family protein [Thermodesulfobacteriota bacterium]|nr:CsgG/HfaB family protein [Thermodesulfobacteriota bacterium]